MEPCLWTGCHCGKSTDNFYSSWEGTRGKKSGDSEHEQTRRTGEAGASGGWFQRVLIEAVPLELFKNYWLQRRVSKVPCGKSPFPLPIYLRTPVARDLMIPPRKCHGSTRLVQITVSVGHHKYIPQGRSRHMLTELAAPVDFTTDFR